MGILSIAAPFVVRLAERLIKARNPNDKRGDERMSLGKKLLKAIGDSVDENANDDTLKGILETVFQQLKLSGELEHDPEGDYYLMRVVAMQKLEGLK